MKRYNPKEIEPRWQKIWAESKIYQAVDFDKRPKFVMLTEFPYPSGAGIHLGHVREYTYGDIIARQKRMQGFNVLYPMGYDEFGLPTENYAIKNKVSPQSATKENVATFQKQLESLGYGIDWQRKVNTSDPNYYKWTQWLFLQFFKKGLAYQDEIAINWCPHCKTGLANEEVINGRHERCDTLVEKKTLKQWLLKITKHADRLIDGLKEVDYPSRIADQQINWIGRSEGINIDYEVVGIDKKITCFTTTPVNYGMTFIVVAPEHEIVPDITTSEQKNTIKTYIKACEKKSDIERLQEEKEKTGAFTGSYAINHLTGKKVPIWVADFVLANFGTGAVQGCPAHDERDFDFAKKFNIPIIRVVEGPNGQAEKFVDPEKEQVDQVKLNKGIKRRMINSKQFDGLLFDEGMKKTMDYFVEKGWGKRVVNYRLRDWIFSRQHYWGEPIPIIHCDEHGAVAVPEDQLPVELPKVKDYEPTDTGESPLSAVKDWVNTTCPNCGKPAKRETDTMPNWAGSSWYYLRYYDAHNDESFANRKKLDYWGAVDMYLGGMEHTTLHLLYSRFWHQFLYDQGLVPTPEPYKARRGQGIILAADNTKMSKSKGNVVNPSDIIDSGYGADALRLSIAFLAPYDQTTPWSPESVAGTHRFLQRIWTLTQEFLQENKVDKAENDQIMKSTHVAIKKVSEDLKNMQFNTAIAALMEYINDLYKIKAKDGFTPRDDWQFALTTLSQLIAPFAPHIAEELWKELGQKGSVHTSHWPSHNEKYLASEHITIVVQVNGKVRANLEMPTDSSEADVVDAAKDNPKVKEYLNKKDIRKTIYVPKKLVNFVI